MAFFVSDSGSHSFSSSRMPLGSKTFALLTLAGWTMPISVTVPGVDGPSRRVLIDRLDIDRLVDKWKAAPDSWKT